MSELLKPFEEMTADDYRDLGMKSGLEIHQQLLTEKKLFCRCPAGHYSNEYDAEILRHMRPTLSELGEYDGTALMEFKTKKNITYRINHQTVCTYEMDDTPPFEINPEALDSALQIAQLMNYKMVGEIHIARKQYLDGSIPTGFQRTTIVGVDGWIKLNGRRIGLIQLGLEEDACREVSDVGHERIYITDRLGMPLIETVTEPVLFTPQEAAEAAQLLRWIVRSTGRVRTGIGAARQDVNVSITGGTRIEIKGVPRIPMIPRLIYNEVMRQHALLKIRDILNSRGIRDATFKAGDEDVTLLVNKTEWDPIAQAVKRGETVRCINLRGYAGILSHRTQTGKTFSKEISDRVRVIACLTRLPNLLTSESTEETIDSYIWNKIRRKMGADSHDALILVWGTEGDVETAVKEIKIRAREAAIGIPNETRQALADSTNGFERILPGAERMYPDTDLPPLEITQERLERLQKQNPPPLWERFEKYTKIGVPAHLITSIAASVRARFFEHVVETLNVPPLKAAVFLFEMTRYWKRKKMNLSKMTDKRWELFFSSALAQPALWQKGAELIEMFLSEEEADFERLLKVYIPPAWKETNLEPAIEKIIRSEEKKISDKQKLKKRCMGIAMQTFKGHVLAEKVQAVLQRKLDAEGGSHE